MIKIQEISSYSPTHHTASAYSHRNSGNMAAVGSPLISKFKMIMKPKAWASASDPMFLRLASTAPAPRFQVLNHKSLLGIQPILISTISGTGMKVSASLQQDQLLVNGGDEVDETTTINTKLYFGNLPYHCDSAQLAGIIQDYATPELIEVLYNRESGRSRGFAFVTMSSIQDCNTVIENLDGREYGGRTLRVNFSDKPKPKEPLYPETQHKLFVGNLSWSVTSESLTQVFREYGNVVGARVLYDGDSGRSRGYGFVSYSTKSEMDTALEALNGVELEGRSMRVSLAEGKRQ